MRRRKAAAPTCQKHQSLPCVQDGLTHARVLGYGRVSTEEQNLDVQITALKAAGADEILVEKVSAVNAKRPMFQLLLKLAEAGDTILFHSLSRMGRDLPQILATLRGLAAEGIAWRSLTEPHLDNKTASGRLMLNITGAMAQFERDQIVERTKRGMDECRRKGMWLGRKPKVTPADVRKMVAMRRRGMTGEKIARHRDFHHLNIKPSTVYARTNELLRRRKK
ncbi:MAG: recombinase family protein [Alphaproteobacteria bacterium]|nr:recombinase family protein [Alphaproteobacteria bacterium]